ncbi:hypothetical protein [Rhizobium mongolense]|uniref:Uncharacterized protein n=1 Tax=Rhizobium mongolense TaxID=57676 RepID=A0A7W6WIS1_9HYPH|nr:hypothetical protein [Rhizobium mongolense]MBB4279350.1 hypothetical protein [Rhizobium mongolense]
MLKRTPIGTRFFNQMIRANDQACYSALQHAEFARQVAGLALERPDAFTAEIFTDNPYAMRMYRRAGELGPFGAASMMVGLQMSVIASYEYADAFSREIQAFRKKHFPSDADLKREEADEETLRRKMTIWCSDPPPNGYFDTLGYVRHRRNHFAHGFEEIEPAFSSYINQRGYRLNKFWDNGRTETFSFDFQDRNPSSISIEQTFGLINMLRVSIICIDELFANTLPFPDLFATEVRAILTDPRSRGLSRRRIASKARTRLEMSYGYRCSAEIANELTEQAMRGSR